MPTGYTATLYDGDQDFEDFALDCARAFGALVTLRDSPTVSVPREFEADTSYHDERLAAAKARLRELESMSLDEVGDAIEEERRKAEARRAELVEKRNDLRARYEAMLEAVEWWTPPTADHLGLKKFMAEQLQQAIDFDCGDIGIDLPDEITLEAWVDKERKAALRNVEYHAAEREKEIERAASRTAWIRALRESLAEKAVI